MLQLEVLILELVAIDRLASSSVPGSEVTTLTQIQLLPALIAIRSESGAK